MSPVAIEPELVTKLTSNGGEVPLIDRDGNPVGYFLSPDLYAAMRTAMYDQAFAEVTEEEVERALADPRRYTTEDVLKLLEGT